MNLINSTVLAYCWAIFAATTFAITNYRDSYISAYMETHSSTETSVGVVYPEPPRTYGPPQPRPPPYYGTPAFPPAPPPEYEATNHPLLEMMFQLPEKLEFLPKLITSFLGVTKVLLKVVLLKIVLKFVIMFCLFFFLPKLEMLDMATDMESKPTTVASASASANSTTSTAPMNDQEEGRLNKMAEFVLESIETKSFLKKHCDDKNHEIICNLFTLLSKLGRYATIPAKEFWQRNVITNEVDNFHTTPLTSKNRP